MLRLCTASVLSTVFVTSALAQPIVENTPDAIWQVARTLGSATLTVDEKGVPHITGDVYKQKYDLRFLACNAQLQCRDMEFSIRYPLNKLSLHNINYWNEGMLYGRATAQDQQLVMTMPVSIYGGMTPANLKTTFELWASTVEQIDQMLLAR